MLPLLVLACTPATDSGPDTSASIDTAAADTSETGDSDTADSAADSATDTAEETPTFAATGTFRGAPFTLACDESGAIGQYSREDGVLQLNARCVDASQGSGPLAVVSLIGAHVGGYVVCTYVEGGANVQVGTTTPSDSETCVNDGSSAFKVQATAVSEHDDTVYFAGSFRYADAEGTTDVSGTFVVNAACVSGC